MGKKKSTKVYFDSTNNTSDLLEYLDLALEGASLGIWDWYLEDNSVKFDHRWARMLGLNIDEIEMNLSTWETRVHPDDLGKCYEDIKAYMDGKTEHYENIHRMKHKDGHWVYILDRGRFSSWDEDGKPTRFTGTHFDITNSERYRKKLSIFFEKSPFGYAFCDLDGNILEVNKTFEQLTGYEFEELKNLSYWEITPKKYEKQEAEQLDCMERTGRYGPYRKEYIRKDGTYIPVELNGFIIEDYDGVKGIWSTIEDISEKKRLERQILQNSKLASIGVLTAGVAHEINNPLAIIQAHVNKLEKLFSQSDEFNKSADKINIAIERITKIISGLRSFSYAESENNSNFNIIETVKSLLNEMKELDQEGKVHYTLDVNYDSDIFVKSSEGKVVQVLTNILKNAIDATVDKNERHIQVKIDYKNDVLSVGIKDNGNGIKESDYQKIFDPFYTTKDVNVGTGIGLYISYNIMKEIGGNIEVNSEIDKGTEFIISFSKENIYLSKGAIVENSIEIKDVG